MKYRVRLTIPATVEVAVDVEAQSQQDAIVAGYDHALAATPKTVTVAHIIPQSAMLDSCEPLTEDEAAGPSAVVAPAATQLPEAPAVAVAAPVPAATRTAARYIVRYYATPATFKEAAASREERLDDYNDAVTLCRAVADDKTEHARCVFDKFGNKVFEMKNEIGGFVVVVYADASAFANRSYQPWSGWHVTAKDANKAALTLLDAGKVYAVGVLDATKQPAVLIRNLSRSSS